MFQTPPQKTTARLLFTEKKLSIPVYQRGYAWDDEEIEEFALDIGNLWKPAKRPEEHFLGTMLTYLKTEGEWLSVMEVIDGQQRITTISVLLIAIREAAKRVLTIDALSDATRRMALDVAQRADECVRVKNSAGEHVPRLSLNEQDDLEWQRLVREGTSAGKVARRSLPRSAQLINSAFDQLTRLVHEGVTFDSHESVTRSVAKLEERLKRTLDSLLIVLLTAQNEKDVYDLFMIINDRGRPLSNVDLLRTSTLQRLKLKVRDFRRAKTGFGLLVNADEGDANRAMTHYANSFSGNRIPKSRVLAEMRSLLFGQADEPADNDTILDRLDLFEAGTRYLLKLSDTNADWYGDVYPYPSALVGADRQYRLLAILKSESCKPLLVAARELIRDERAFCGLLGTLERIVFRVLITGGVHKSQLADFFIDQAQQLRQNPSTWSAETMWRDALAPELPEGRVAIDLVTNCPDAKFRVGVEALSYKKQRGYITYLLHGIETYDSQTQRPKTDVTFNFKQLHLDHIVPQSDEAHAVVESGLEHTVGNIVILSGSRNQSIGGQPYGPEKARAYVQSSIRMTREIGANAQAWTVENVKERTKELAAAACKVWSLSERGW